MTQNSKSKTLIIISIIALVLIVLIYQNKFNVDNSETITPTPPIKKSIQPKRTVHVQPQTKQTQKSAIQEDSEITLEEKRKKMERKLNMSLMLKTPEKVVEVIENLQEQGKEELANEYIDYLITTFPDYNY